MQAFEFTEITEKGENFPVTDRSIAPVGFNSIVRVKVKPENFPIAGIGIPGLTGDDISKQRETLIEILVKLDEYTALAKEFQKLFAEINGAKGGVEKNALENQLKEIRTKRNDAANFVITKVST